MRRKTAEKVVDEKTNWFLSQPNVSGVCVEYDKKEKPYIKVFVIKLKSDTRKKMPKEIEGYRVEIEETGEISSLG